MRLILINFVLKLRLIFFSKILKIDKIKSDADGTKIILHSHVFFTILECTSKFSALKYMRTGEG